MRPLYLRLAGLHSFREAQEIDFSTLCQGGVFGIFGPTGSGKSTILDAITLALYGKVERAPNNTQGILNQAEEFCEVTFTFALHSAYGDEVYRVERRYQRSGDYTIRNQVSRLLRLGTEVEVLAEKDRDVTRGIEELLGLTLDDFTRAVVLPQGKFAEFLQLKGSERRQMLQRLFHLERYGDELNERLRNSLQGVKQELSLLVAEQQGLGDITEDGLKETEKAWQDAQTSLAQLLLVQKELEQAYTDGKARWDWQQQLTGWEERQRVHQQKKDAILTLQTSLQQAQQIEELFPWYEAYRQTSEQVLDDQARLQQAAQAFDESNQAYLTMKEQLTTLMAIKNEKEPRWLQQQARLQQLVQVEAELEEHQRWLVQTKKEMDRLEQSLQDFERQWITGNEQLTQYSQALTIHQEELKGLTMEHQQKEQILKAVGAKQAFLSVKTKFAELRQAYNTEVDKQMKQQQEWQKWQEQQSQWLTTYEQVEGEQNRLHLLLEQWLAEQQKGVERLQQGLSFFQRKRKEDEIALYARRLAATLEHGEPCPVCGSTHHPRKAQEEAGAHENWLAWEDRLDQAITAGEKPLQHGRLLQIKMQHQADELTTLQHHYTEVGQAQLLLPPFKKEPLNSREVASTQEFHEENAERHGLDMLQWELVNWEEFQQVWHDQMKQAQAQLQHVEAAYQEHGERIRQLQSTWQGSLLQLEKLQLEKFQIQEQLEKLTQDITVWEKKDLQQEKSWQEYFPSLPVEEVDPAYEQLMKQEKERERVQHALAEDQHQLQAQQAVMNQLSEEQRQIESQLIRLETEWTTRQTHTHQLQEKLDHVLQGKKAEELLAQISSRLEHMQLRIGEHQKGLDELTVKREQALLQLEAGKETLRQGEIHLAQRKQAWLEKCTQARFNPEQRLDGLRVDRGIQQEWQVKIEAYLQQEQQIMTNIGQLEERLAEKRLTQEEWDDLQQKSVATKKAYEELLQTVARLERDVEEYQKRFARYQELEQVHIEAMNRLSLQEELQTVLRGNAFVEYLAEEQLESICLVASDRLRQLTHQRYALALDSQGGFIIRDDANGGLHRPVHTLSGGETFLTSLALALSLSAQIQLRGEYPLQFFFLDEGFGTLDVELLDTVITTLEKLQSENISIGVISHVPELRSRLPRRLMVKPAEPTGEGSQIKMEML